MRLKFTILTFLISFIAFAQIPPGYYSTATGTGYTLKTQLHNIIKDHIDRTYSGLYTTYLTSDRDYYYENNGTMLDMYTENPTGPECEFTYGINQDDGTGGNAECERYNREHTIPQSVFGSALPMYSDAHFVIPSDKYVNAQRADFPYSRVNTASGHVTYSNGSKRGQNLNSGYSAGFSGTVFEPIDEFKGDIARIFFYFATRYENFISAWSYPMFNNTSTQVFSLQAINVLLTWHQLDPVSQRERDRNNAIYARQNNRNPFIDNPNYATQIWGSLLNTNSVSLEESVSIYPNPSTDGSLTIRSIVPIDSITIFNVNGQTVQKFSYANLEQESNSIQGLASGFYFVTIQSQQQTLTKKIVVK